MSVDIMNRIWWREDLDPTTKFVAIALGDAASDEGMCWPSIGTLMRKTGFGRRAVQKALAHLEGMQLLRKHYRSDSSTVYIFVVDNLPLIERTRGEKEASLFDTWPRAPDAPGPAHLMHPPAHAVRPPRASDAPPPRTTCAQTVSETSEEPSLLDLGDFKSPGREPLHVHVESEWDKLKRDHPGVSAIRKVDDGLRHTIELRARQHAKHGQDGYAVWDEFFETVRRSAFLTGRAPPGRGRDKPFALRLAWASSAQHFREIMEGKYDGISDQSGYDSDTGRRLGPTEQALRGAVTRLRNAKGRSSGSGDPPGAHACIPG